MAPATDFYLAVMDQRYVKISHCYRLSFQLQKWMNLPPWTGHTYSTTVLQHHTNYRHTYSTIQTTATPTVPYKLPPHLQYHTNYRHTYSTIQTTAT